jgi:hypothetical protein
VSAALGEAPALRRLYGVTLAQYAGVQAGIAARVPIEEVLANERVTPEAWPDAESAWQDRLLEDETDALQDEHDRVFELAQERYVRKVSPLDEDLGAWLSVVRRVSGAEDPTAWLAERGLSAADVLHLHRVWARRLADDPSLQRRALAILSADPAEIPPIVTGVVEPIPPGDDAGSAGVNDDIDEHATPGTGDDVDDLDDVEPASMPDALVFFAPLPGDEAAAEGAPAALTSASIAMIASKAAALPFMPAENAPASTGPFAAATAVPGATAVRAPAMLSGASLAVMAPKVPGLPFTQPAATVTSTPQSGSTASAPDGPRVERAPADLSKTTFGAIAPMGPVLPFDTSASSSATTIGATAATGGLPFAAAADLTGPAGLSLQQYASLSVELAVVPGEADDILRRYQITAEQRAELNDHWRRRISHDPTLWAAFDRMYATYKAWFVASRRGERGV